MQVKQIVADENINYNIVKKLKVSGFDVYSIMEKHSGITDEEVIALTKERNAILLTEDSDFGEWVFAHHIKNICVVFMRYHYQDAELIGNNLINLLQDKKHKFENTFFVLTTKKLRVRNI